jgi:hypothetical protein
MAHTEPNELPVVDAQRSPCRHLRTAGMYIYGDGSKKTDEESYESSSYWCLQTMKNFGPDDEMVAGRECRDPSRSCYEPL